LYSSTGVYLFPRAVNNLIDNLKIYNLFTLQKGINCKYDECFSLSKIYKEH
jgi:hypothetical protein